MEMPTCRGDRISVRLTVLESISKVVCGASFPLLPAELVPVFVQNSVLGDARFEVEADYRGSIEPVVVVPRGRGRWVPLAVE